ncbi:MAG: alpha-amylase family glycosyl hydrolase [Caldilineaceae bacterium]
MQTCWWKESIAYQIYPRSFADNNGDGIGDLRGITQSMLSTLGVNLLWINPFYTIPQSDNGYDVSDYEDIHPDFGNMADVEETIAQAHTRNMRIMLDVVINHTSDQHAWFNQSTNLRDNPYTRLLYLARRGEASRTTGWLTYAINVDLRHEPTNTTCTPSLHNSPISTGRTHKPALRSAR